MSYCRWSSDGHRSDVYTYEHVDGTWTTHVAGRRRTGLNTLPPEPDFRKINSPEWSESYGAYYDALDKLELVEIELPHAGKTFKDETPQACAVTLRMLRGLGYHVPDGVIDELESEATAVTP